MKVIEPRRKEAVERKARGLVANLLADDFELREQAEQIERVEIAEVSQTVPIVRKKERNRQRTPIKHEQTPPPQEAPQPTETPKPVAVKPARLVSIDAFRGLTVALMLLVNNIALDTLTPDALTHAQWNQGLHLADYVFPWFLLCVGLSIPFSFASFRKKNLPSWRLDVKIVARAAGLIGLGCLLNAAISRQVVFTLGVLQLIGLAYLGAAFLYELPMVRRGIIATGMLVGYGMAIKYLPVPGSPIGTFDETANFIEHINKTYLLMYNLDGLLSAIPTCALMIYATFVGDALLNKKFNHLNRLTVLGVSGAVMVIAGVLASSFLPYNKPVWTPSYLLMTGGAGVLMLAAFYLFTDAVKWTKWPYPLLVLGTNALVAYVLPVLIKVMVFSAWGVNSSHGFVSVQDAFLNSLVDNLGRVPGGWLYTSLYIGACWLFLHFLYKKRTFLRV